jgi:ribonuclease G
MLFNATQAEELRVAIVDGQKLIDLDIESAGKEQRKSNIYKGVITRVEPSLEAVFVDYGAERHGFLPFKEIAKQYMVNQDGGEFGRSKMATHLKAGSELIVQVDKDERGNKGAALTTYISLAGRYLVLMPYTEQFGISRKIEDPKERQRLRRIMQKLSVPEGMGIIMRTVAQGTRARHFVRDLAMLLEQWAEVEEKRDKHPAPVCTFREPGLIERTARDFLTDEVEQVLCDDAAMTEQIREIAGKISRRAKRRIHHLASAPVPIFEKIGIQKQIDEAFSRQVWLPCGGYIVIDETEALISIDVNTGRNRGSKDVDKMILETNVEAAVEVARQLRLRNIGGLVVVDFIDMRHRKDQQAVYKAMKDRLKKDKAKTQVLQISPIGLMEMTRQRLNESLRETMFEPCPYCQGRGRVKTTMTMSVEIQRKLNSVIHKHRDTVGDLVVVVNADVLNRFKSEDSRLLVEIERQHSGRLIFRSDPSLHRERFVIVDAATDRTIEQG